MYFSCKIDNLVKMKLILLCSFICFINGLTLDFKFSNETTIYKKPNETYKLYTTIILKNETEPFTQPDGIKYDFSCIEMYEESKNFKPNQISLQSSCVDMFCKGYMIDANYGTIGPTNLCPLAGIIKEANLFIKKKFNVLYNFNDNYIFIEGCYFIDENGTKLEVVWIMSEYYGFEESLYSQVHDNEFLFKRYRTEDIVFNDMNRSCSNLCVTHLCNELEVFEEPKPIADFGLSKEEFLYVGSIVCVITFIGVIIFCLKKRFM